MFPHCSHIKVRSRHNRNSGCMGRTNIRRVFFYMKKIIVREKMEQTADYLNSKVNLTAMGNSKCPHTAGCVSDGCSPRDLQLRLKPDVTAWKDRRFNSLSFSLHIIQNDSLDSVAKNVDERYEGRRNRTTTNHVPRRGNRRWKNTRPCSLVVGVSLLAATEGINAGDKRNKNSR